MENVVLCIDPSDLFYQTVEDQKVVIAKLIHRIQAELPFFSKIDFTRKGIEALRRLNYMEEMILQMRDLPTSSSETKYGITGGTPI